MVGNTPPPAPAGYTFVGTVNLSNPKSTKALYTKN
jgi:hypothetical protein